MKLDRISERVYANTEGETGGNVGVIILEDSLAAVDAQFPASGARFRSSITSISKKPISHLLLTHCHPDHVFGNQAFEDCEIVAHRLLKERMEENLKTIWTPNNLERMIEEMKRNAPERVWLLKDLRIVLPTKTFDDCYKLDGVEIIHTGGHTAGSSIVYVEEDRILFAGDIIFAKSFPWAGDPTSDPDAWIRAFKAILNMDAERIIPGHGPICDKAEVKIQLDWFEAVKDEMKKLIEEGKSAEEAVKHDGYPSFYEPKRPEWKENSLRHLYTVWSK
ncbi:MAG: MBL fold metallo-hydrolase [Promethearchaeota archaeon]